MSRVMFPRTTQRRRAAFIDGYEFPPGYSEKLTNALPDVPADRHSDVIAALRQFFQVCRVADGALVGMPSRAVDEAWHSFILFTRDYATFCESAFGRFLHHTPDAGVPGSEMQVATTRAWAIACQTDGTDPTAPAKTPLLFRLDSELGIAPAPDLVALALSVDRDLPRVSRRMASERARASTYVGGDAGSGVSSCGGGGGCGGGGCGGGG